MQLKRLQLVGMPLQSCQKLVGQKIGLSLALLLSFVVATPYCHADLPQTLGTIWGSLSGQASRKKNNTPHQVLINERGLQKRISQHNCTMRSSLLPKARRTLESRSRIQAYDVMPYVESVRCQKSSPAGFAPIPPDLVAMFSRKVDPSVIQYSRLVAPGLVEYVNRGS
jgi:hypothetical protein